VEAARLATEADVPDIADLVRLAIAELAPMRGGAVWEAQESRQEPLEAALSALIGAADTRVLVGTIDDVIVGYAVARQERLSDGTLLGVVEDIFVDPGAREVGLGEAMMGDLVRWCAESGCIGMDAIALPGHRSTKNFFEESGFTARKIVMHRSLLPAEDSVQATQAGDSVQATQAGDSVQATQAGHGVQATQAGHSVQATQAGDSVQATQAGQEGEAAPSRP
jgi:GNAT superfamily N-acetyltransferase